MREFAQNAVLGDRVGEDFSDGPVRRRGGDDEDVGADFAGGKDALCLAGIAVIVSNAALGSVLRKIFKIVFLHLFCLEVAVCLDGCAIALYDRFKNVLDHGVQVALVLFEPAVGEAGKTL
jgi:hypothetical protein